VNLAIGWKVQGIDGNDYRVLEADHDHGTYLIGELASFDENSEYGPLHPLSYLFTCQVEGNLIS
jgi:hypothetical protein